MPTYDYRCEKGHVFELFHSIKDDSPRFCPRCDAPAKRVPSGGAGLLFKGSGFYITDYRSDSYKKAAKGERTSGGSGGESKGAAPSGGSGGSSKGTVPSGASGAAKTPKSD